MPSEDENAPQETKIERRVALRRGAAVLAGAAGLSAAAAAAASPASAAPGDPVVLGANNTGAGSLTTVASTSATGTLQVANTGVGAPLRVAVEPGPAGIPSSTSVMGDHHSTDNDQDGFAFSAFTHVTGTGDTDPALWGFVYTDVWAFQPIPVTPQRALDTRRADGRVRILDPAGNLDSAGRVLGGHSITLSLSDFAFGFGAVFGNITVTGPLATGFATVYPADPRPPTSSVGYSAGQTASNACFTGFTFTGDDITLRIFVGSTAHVIFDVSGFAVGSTGNINPVILPAAATSASARARQVKVSTAPAWYRQQQARRSR
jgi:hypothetical protein